MASCCKMIQYSVDRGVLKKKDRDALKVLPLQGKNTGDEEVKNQHDFEDQFQ